MRSLDDLPEGEIATYRELKAALGLGDGVLFANLKVLKSMGYLNEQKVSSQGEKMHAYSLTRAGREALVDMKNWVARWVETWNNKSEKS
jgi:DNA-binding HxlR family transcriptional regulator